MRLGYLHRTHRRRKVAPRRHPVPDLIRLFCRSASNAPIDTSSTPGAPLFALTFSHASWTAHFEISNGLPGDFNSFTRLLPNPHGFAVDLTNTVTNDPAPSLHPHYRGFPTTTSRSASRTRNGTHTRTRATPSRPPAKTERAVSTPAFSCFMQKPQTGLASPPCRTPPGQSAGTRQTHPGIMDTPRFRCHLCSFRHVNGDSLALAFPIPT